MRKAGLILMVVSLVSVLFGCAKAQQQQWSSLTYHVTSSVHTEGCHFTVCRIEKGMTISGFCFDGEKEYRIDEAKSISRETATYIDGLELKKEKASIGKICNVADGVQVTVKLCYPDGSEDRISLDTAVRKQLLQRLKRELIGK